MKKNIFYGIKAAVFVVIAALAVSLVNHIERNKSFARNNWPTTSTYAGFYKMPKDSIDVLFLGSSHAVNAFSPQELYDQYGITSYNLSSEQQNLLTSYYWMKEALKYQKPKAVVLDTYIMQWYNANEPLNSGEPFLRMAIDPMRFGKVKGEAIRDICKYDKNQDIWSYYLTNIRFHTRWTWLGSDDFAFWEGEEQYETKGNGTIYYSGGNTEYQPFSETDSSEQGELMPLMMEYAKKIVDLCRENGIQLILVKTPTTATNVQLHNAVNAFAETNEVPFIDLNEKNNYDELNFDFAADMADDGHANVSGAVKNTDYVGKILKDDYEIQPQKNEVWEETKQYYQEVKDIFSFPHETDLVSYLKKLNSNRYSIFISVKDEASNGLNQEVIDAMRELGFTFDLKGKHRYSYIAVKTDEEQYEEISDQQITRKGTFWKGRNEYIITSAGFDCGNVSSINLKGNEYSKNQRGLNIVVYDNAVQRLIDSVCFDTYDEQIPVVR